MKTLLPVLFAAVITVSCQKEVKNDCATNMQNLAGTYKLTALKYKANASANEQDYLVYKDDCEKDDLIVLKSDGTFDYQDAGTSCTPNQNDHGNWLLTGNTITSDGMLDGIITSFDCKTLVLYSPDIFVGGDKMIFTMTKQ